MNLSKWFLTNGGDLQIGLFFGLFALLAAAERIVPMRPTYEKGGDRWRANLGLTALNLVLLGVLPISFISAAQWASNEGWGLLNLVALPLPMAVIANLLLRGFISFFTHFVAHKIPVLWRIHRVHHLDTDMDVSTTVRIHPLEFVVNLAIGIPLVVGFGFSPWLLVLYEVLDVCITLWSHSNTRLPAAVDGILRYFVVTPDLHRIHHSTWQPETDSNFSAVFPIWDIMFGTFRPNPREMQESMPLGLEEVRGSRANRLLWLLVSPLYGELRDAPNDSFEISRLHSYRSGKLVTNDQ
jgi:sterol desaturase/sphingolipid hydroxylase (fatty acid hydroxylase superfamily)